VNLSCVIRTGSPAAGVWTVTMLAMPQAWVEKYAADITKTRALGTGEDDYALLLITGTADGSALPSSFPSIPLEIHRSPHVGDPAFLAAYPAEFIKENPIQGALNGTSALTSIKQLLTFNESTVDVIALGGVVLAQSGSSGGAVVDAEGDLIGIISTTSEGATPDERNLQAITLPYINRSMTAQTGIGLDGLLAKNVLNEADAFTQNKAPALARLFLDQLNIR